MAVTGHRRRRGLRRRHYTLPPSGTTLPLLFGVTTAIAGRLDPRLAPAGWSAPRDDRTTSLLAGRAGAARASAKAPAVAAGVGARRHLPRLDSAWERLAALACASPAGQRHGGSSLMRPTACEHAFVCVSERDLCTLVAVVTHLSVLVIRYAAWPLYASCVLLSALVCARTRGVPQLNILT